MKQRTRFLAAVMWWAAAGPVLAHESAHHAVAATPPAAQEQLLTGEVVDTSCYLSHGAEGLGRGHASCAKKCIESGLPVAIRTGNQLYLATMADHTPANKLLAKFAGQQVTVHGTILEQDGQRLVVISKVEKAN